MALKRLKMEKPGNEASFLHRCSPRLREATKEGSCSTCVRSVAIRSLQLSSCTRSFLSLARSKRHGCKLKLTSLREKTWNVIPRPYAPACLAYGGLCYREPFKCGRFAHWTLAGHHVCRIDKGLPREPFVTGQMMKSFRGVFRDREEKPPPFHHHNSSQLLLSNGMLEPCSLRLGVCAISSKPLKPGMKESAAKRPRPNVAAKGVGLLKASGLRVDPESPTNQHIPQCPFEGLRKNDRKRSGQAKGEANCVNLAPHFFVKTRRDPRLAAARIV